MKKVIVTGGLGFIGSNLIKILLKKNILLLIQIKSLIPQIFITLKKYQKIKNINLLNWISTIVKKFFKS